MASDIVTDVNSANLSATATANQQQAVMVPRGIKPGDAQPKNSDTETKAETPQAIEDVVDNVNQYVQNISRHLNFSIEKDTGKTVIKVVDAKTDELVRQIPTEEFLELAKALEKAKGILLRAEV